MEPKPILAATNPETGDVAPAVAGACPDCGEEYAFVLGEVPANVSPELVREKLERLQQVWTYQHRAKAH